LTVVAFGYGRDMEDSPERREPTTRELRLEQADRETQEHRLRDTSEQPAEADQHERRREKAAYLKGKLAARERSEQQAEVKRSD
jgi:hypothetical protein